MKLDRRALLAIILVTSVIIAIVGYALVQSGRSAFVTEFESCDIDRDRDCDQEDRNLATRALGQCEGGELYNELADADHDGCVSSADLDSLFSKTR